MRTPSLLGVALLCLFAMPAATDDGSVSVEARQYCASNFPKPCGVKNFKDWYKVGPYCAKYFNTPSSFPDAEFACRQKAAGGHLVSVHEEQANSDVLCIVMKYNYSSPRIWLGAMELFQSKKFIWTDGSLWNFEKWVPGQPDNTHNAEDCVEMNWNNTGLWNDDSCERKKNFVCSFKPGGRV
ncbi:lectin-like [Brienomyrus brachyistius]|uniref:lectin-like n=1 Tax=Brienomyrus brachyistius TaxID=42636 RepID=UPI0020B3CB3B|nr:lectin-like [Brienomyrus brachyistius]XP_048861459.1 lectin-like [Brienomyrus brachyistius]